MYCHTNPSSPYPAREFPPLLDKTLMYRVELAGGRRDVLEPVPLRDSRFDQGGVGVRREPAITNSWANPQS